jgi:predicted porin
MYTVDLSEFHVNAGFAGETGNIGDSKARQYTLAYNYLLSKRTKVYTFVTKIDDGKAGLYGGDFRSFAVGLRHNF